PGFSPERGKPLGQRDKDDQEISYASQAQFPTPIQPDQFNWQYGAGKHLRHAYAENRYLVAVNKGPGDSGFRVCESCGAAWPAIDKPPGTTHARPYLVDNYVLKNAGLQWNRAGPLHAQPLYLGFSFLTDLLLLRIALHEPLAYHPGDPWLHDALRTVAEASAL